MWDEMSVQWTGVREYTKAMQEKGTYAVAWAVQLSAAMALAGVAPPSPELAHVLVSHLCWANDVPLAWKYIEKALIAGLAPPAVLLTLLSSRLLDATLDDEGLLELTPEKKFRWPIRTEDMEIDGEVYCQRNGYGEKLQKLNSVKAVELILQFLQHK